jgi:hypothetical protein
MGRKSSIERLPDELRARLLKLLNDPNVTQLQIAEIINDEAGEQVVSKSAVNRYAVRMREFQEKNRQAREVAQVYVAQYGSDTQNQLGKLVNEQVRMLVFELLMAIDEIKKSGDDPEMIESLAFTTSKIAKAIKDLESSSTINMEREEKMRAATKKAAEEVESTVRKAGLTDETVEQIKARILGITK